MRRGSIGGSGRSPCTAESATPASRILTDAAHPCRARVAAAYGRLVRVVTPAAAAAGAAAGGGGGVQGSGNGGSAEGASGGGGADGEVHFSATIVSTGARRGGGLLVTCAACGAPATAGLRDPESRPPIALRVLVPATARPGGGDADASAPATALHFAHRLLGGPVPMRGAPAPGDDFALAALDGAPAPAPAPAPSPEEYSGGGPVPRAKLVDRRVPIDDPGRLTAAKAPFLHALPGSSALVLGFSREAGGELVASVGPVLDDDTARALLARAGGEEAATPYDPATELVIAARATPGMIGGGVFDDSGRFVGVVVRATARPIGGRYLVRAARATHIAARLSAALREAPLALREAAVAFLP